jgi:hypothetical protein
LKRHDRSADPIFHFLFSIFFAALAAGCAAPSEPTARHAPTPEAVTDLAAVQQGHRVNLTFTLPKKTTDAKPLPADPSIEIYRQIVPAGAKMPATPTFAQRDLAVTIPAAMVSHYTEDRRVEFPFELKGAKVGEPSGEQMLFMVRTRVNEKRDSADSNVVALHLYEPFAAVKISAKVTHDAIVLSGWGVALPGPAANIEGIPTDAHYRVYRGEITSGTGATQPAAAAATKPGVGAEAGGANQPSAAGTAGQTAQPHLEQIAELPLTTMQYEDTNFSFDHTYVYSVRTVAKYGANWVESDDSNLLIVTPKDIFPPAAPQGLVIVYVAATPDVPAHLEISWAISPESDLQGYDIYRSVQGEETGRKLTARPLLTPAYRDMSIEPGRSYTYTVRAVDRAGNESPASEPASINVPADEQNRNP